MKTQLTVLSCAALVALAGSSFAQTATTKPVGYRTETLQPGFNLLGVNLADKVEAAGAFNAGTSGSVVVDSDVNFQSLSLGTSTLLVKILDGSAEGTVLSGVVSGANQLTLDSSLPSGVADGTKYEVRKAHTISSLFGANNSAGLKAGPDENSADTIYIYEGAGQFSILYYSDGTGFDDVGWAKVGGGNANLALSYGESFFIRNSQNTSKNVVFVGHVVTSKTKVVFDPNFNFVSRVLPVGIKLIESGLESSLQSGPDENSADTIYIPNGPGSYAICYYSDGTGFDDAGWTQVGSGAVTDLQLTSGVIVRRLGTTSGSLTINVPSSLDL